MTQPSRGMPRFRRIYDTTRVALPRTIASPRYPKWLCCKCNGNLTTWAQQHERRSFLSSRLFAPSENHDVERLRKTTVAACCNRRANSNKQREPGERKSKGKGSARAGQPIYSWRTKSPAHNARFMCHVFLCFHVHCAFVLYRPAFRCWAEEREERRRRSKDGDTLDRIGVWIDSIH